VIVVLIKFRKVNINCERLKRNSVKRKIENMASCSAFECSVWCVDRWSSVVVKQIIHYRLATGLAATINRSCLSKDRQGLAAATAHLSYTPSNPLPDTHDYSVIHRYS
jgi:hypothetical protein